jgi:hypothetical protein
MKPRAAPPLARRRKSLHEEGRDKGRGMDFGQIFQDFQYQDFQWLIPVLSGFVIILGALLVALVRGMTGGVLLALLFGGLMSLSPTLLAALEHRTATAAAAPGDSASVDVARGAAELSLLNSEVVTELSSVMGTLRNAMAGLTPQEGASPAPDPAAVQLFTQSLTDTDAQLERTTSGIERMNRVVANLRADVARLEAEISTDPDSDALN